MTMRRIFLVALLASGILAGCSQEKPLDDSKPAPPPTYHMVPSQKSGN